MAKQFTSHTEQRWFDKMRQFSRLQISSEHALVPDGQPQPDAMVNYGWEFTEALPAYSINEELVPFVPAVADTPDQCGHKDLFQRWQSIHNSPAKLAQVKQHAKLFTEQQTFRPKDFAKQLPEFEKLPKPADFGEAPWQETIASYDAKTYRIQVMVPRETYEQQQGFKDLFPLRGWLMHGEGIIDAEGKRQHPLVVVMGGRSVQTFARHDKRDPMCQWDNDKQAYINIDYPKAGSNTEFWGARQWRDYLRALVAAGYDVLTFEKRGHGYSGGETANNCAEQAEDIFRVLEACENGTNLSILDCNDQPVSNTEAKSTLLRDVNLANIPMYFMGSSQGSSVIMWAMHRACVGSIELGQLSSKRQYQPSLNMKGAILLAPMPKGLGAQKQVNSDLEAYFRFAHEQCFFPSQEITDGMHYWPALCVVKGSWDFLEGLADTLHAVQLFEGPKQLIVVRGEHSENSWGNDNISYAQANICQFIQATLGLTNVELPHTPSSLKALLESAPNYWPPYCYVR